MNPETLLPHSGRALLLSRIITSGAENLEGEAIIRDSYPLAIDGTAPCLVGIEIAAQAAAALEALKRAEGGAGGGGRLVRVDDATFTCGTLPVNSAIDVKVRRESVMLPLVKYRVEIATAGRLCMEARLSIFLLG